MATELEKRARKNADENCLVKLTDAWYIRFNAYKDGATDQLNIDIEKAVWWLYNCENIKVEGLTWEEFLNNFKEAMEK